MNLFSCFDVVPSEGPPNIICANTSSRSLSIRWSVLPVNKAHGIVRSYKIFLKRSDGREHTMIDTQPSISRNTSFFDLDEFVEYTVEILGITMKGEGNRSEPVHCLTDEDGTFAQTLELKVWLQMTFNCSLMM